MREHVETVAKGEVGEGHQVANGLHNVPTQVVERPHEDHRKLAKDDGCAKVADHIGLFLGAGSDAVDLRLGELHLSFELLQSSLNLWQCLRITPYFIISGCSKVSEHALHALADVL